MMLIKRRVPGFLNRVTVSKRLLEAFGLVVPRYQNVVACLITPSGALLIPAANIVTNDGDLYYAERGAGASPTNTFGVHELGSAGTPGKAANRSSFTPIASTEKAHAATYPKVNDADADNTEAGADIITYLANYAKADFNAAGISHGWITNATPGASEPILTGYAFASTFEKTANDTLKVFVNHSITGV